MFKRILSLALFLGIFSPLLAQAPVVNESALTSSNKSDGLELPADQTVKFDEGFVTLQAKCKGEVKWLVISAVKIKYFSMPGNSIVVSVPPQGGLVTVFAVGLVDGKLTEFARTNITISGAKPPAPTPTPTPVTGPMHVTFIVDLNNSSPELGQIINSQKIRQAVTTKGSFYRLYDIKSPVLKEKGLDKAVQELGGVPVIIIQSNTGKIEQKFKMPKTEAEVLQLLGN